MNGGPFIVTETAPRARRPRRLPPQPLLGREDLGSLPEAPGVLSPAPPSRTQALCSKLKDLELLEPMQARISLGTGQQVALAGFSAVNREKLNALSGDQLESFARAQVLEPIFAHRISLKNFSLMVEPATKAAGAGEMTDTALG